MSGIKSDSARVETAYESDGRGRRYGFVDIRKCPDLMGYGMEFQFFPSLGLFVIASRPDNPTAKYLVVAPSERWLQDIKDAGYVVEHVLTEPEKPAAASASAPSLT